MAEWTIISDTVLEPGKPARSVDALAFRDNPIAIAEGASGAPRIDGAISPALRNAGVPNGELGAEKFQTGTTERDWVLARTASAGAGAVGTYALLRCTLQRAPGETISGSSLRYADASGGADIAGINGTWRCMGRSVTIDNESGTTVFLRIS